MPPELLHSLFALVCGQNPAHTWAPGGFSLPCCQRCSGLYAGAAVAAVLQLWLRPEATRRFLWIHGVFLLLMLPCGLHWLPQGPVLRTLSGLLFGFGIVGFLVLVPASVWSRVQSPRPEVERLYFSILCAWLALLPLAAIFGGQETGLALSVLLLAGFLALTLLTVANLCLLPLWVFRRTRQRSEKFSLLNSPKEHD